MDIPVHPAITAFCHVIAELPEETRRIALGFLCTALGQSRDPTGIPFSPDRPIRHLYWDHETEDLYKRLVYLVEDVGVKEQLAVQAAVSYISTHFAQWADPTFSQSSAGGFRRTIDKMENELQLPVERRGGQRSDEQITALIKHLHELIESAEARRQDAEDTHNHLSSSFEAAFTLQFWDVLNQLEVDRSRPQIDDLLNPKEDDDKEDSNG